MNFVFCLQIKVKNFFKFLLIIILLIKIIKLLLLFSVCVCPGILKLPPKILLFLCTILRKNWIIKLIFCMQVSMKVCYNLIVMGWSRISKIPIITSLQCLYSISKKKLKLKLNFYMHNFLKFYFNTLSIKVSYKVDCIIIKWHDQVFSNYSK